MVAVALLFGILVSKVGKVVIVAALRILNEEFFIKMPRLHAYNYYNGRECVRIEGRNYKH